MRGVPRRGHRTVVGIGCLLLGLFAGIASSAVASTLFGPVGRFSALFDLEWQSGCSKPYWIMLSHNQEDLNRAFSEYQDYVACLKSRAAADSDYASQVVVDSAKAELRKVTNEGVVAGVLVP